MTYFTSWEEFAKGVEKLYLVHPNRCRFVTKYCHKKGTLTLKMTDDIVCLQYRTEQQQDLKRLEKLQMNNPEMSYCSTPWIINYRGTRMIPECSEGQSSKWARKGQKKMTADTE